MANPTGAEPPVVPATSWWSRHWPWVVVPMGCLGALATLAGFIALILVFVFGLMHSTDAYKEAVAKARSDAAVAAAIGTPVKEGWFTTGQFKVDGASGTADLTIPISGPKGAGTIHAVATKSDGVWTFSTLSVKVDGSGSVIDLRAATP